MWCHARRDVVGVSSVVARGWRQRRCWLLFTVIQEQRATRKQTRCRSFFPLTHSLSISHFPSCLSRCSLFSLLSSKTELFSFA